MKKTGACISALFPAFVAIERTVLVIAAILALLPLWQYYQESDARRLDRVFNLIAVGDSCENIQNLIESDFGTSSQQSASDRRQGESFFENGINMRSLHELCAEVGKALATDEVLEETMQRLENMSEAFGTTGNTGD